MQHLEVSCAVRRFFKSLGFKGLIMLPLMKILQRNLKRTTDTFLYISHTKNVHLFKFRCNIFIGVRIIKEMPGSVASGTHCTIKIRA